MSELRLSKSQLDKFVGCPRCFWMKHRAGLDQPDMISSKVWKGIERVTTAHYAAHRKAKTTPDNLQGQVPPGAVPVQLSDDDMKALRYWGSGLAYKVDNILVTTALDDMLQRDTVDGLRLYNVIDYKSKSKLTDEESTAGLYQNQADVFDYACNANKFPTDGVVYFDYWAPVSVEGAEPDAVTPARYGFTIQRWTSQIIKVNADHERMKKLVRAAAACLDSKMPEPRITREIVQRGKNKGQEKLGGCPVCVYLLDREDALEALKKAKPAPAAPPAAA